MKIEKQIELQDIPSLDCLKGKLRSIVLVDFSWLQHKAWYAYPTFTYTVGGVEVHTGDIYGVLRSLTSIVTRRMNAAVVLVLDGSVSTRRAQCPSYKAGREDTHKSDIYLKTPEILQAACLLSNVFISYSPQYEADDVIATLATCFESCGLEVLIHTRDNDLMQCLTSGVRMFHKFKGKSFEYITVDTVLEKFGVPPECLAVFRALKGDKSDNLPGYARIPTKFAQFFSQMVRFPSDYYKLSEEDYKGLLASRSRSEKIWLKKLWTEPDIFKKNWTLMKLQDVGQPRICRCEPSWRPIDKYGLSSIRNVLDRIALEAKE